MWWRASVHIKPVFADVAPATVEPEHISAWYARIRRTNGLDAAHKALKIWRAMWRVMVAYKLCMADADPSQTIRNTAPKGRSETWTEGEAVRLVKRALRMGYGGLACVIATLWDSQFSPVDGRTVTPRQYHRNADGAFFIKARDKSGTESIVTLSRRTEKLIEAYLATCPVEMYPDAPMFRSRTWKPYSKDILTRDFRAVRAMEFPGDTRKLMDFRRSGSVEALAGGVDATVLSAKMANSIARSKRLQDTYLPERVTTVRLADEARRRGRTRLRENE